MADWNKNNELDEQELEQATGGTGIEDVIKQQSYFESFFGGTSYIYCRCTKCGDVQRFELFNPKMCMKCGGALVEI